jgi:hypothetical protein
LLRHFGRSPEIPTVACVGVAETAAEKLVSLTRRTATELAGENRNPDPTLVRRIYDLHVTRSDYDATEVVEVAREVMLQDAEEFANQFPVYCENPLDETSPVRRPSCRTRRTGNTSSVDVVQEEVTPPPLHG